MGTTGGDKKIFKQSFASVIDVLKAGVQNSYSKTADTNHFLPFIIDLNIPHVGGCAKMKEACNACNETLISHCVYGLHYLQATQYAFD